MKKLVFITLLIFFNNVCAEYTFFCIKKYGATINTIIDSPRGQETFGRKYDSDNRILKLTINRKTKVVEFGEVGKTSDIYKIFAINWYPNSKSIYPNYFWAIDEKYEEKTLKLHSGGTGDINKNRYELVKHRPYKTFIATELHECTKDN